MTRKVAEKILFKFREVMKLLEIFINYCAINSQIAMHKDIAEVDHSGDSASKFHWEDAMLSED